MNLYGGDIYLGSGVKLLSTAEMGVAFDIVKQGQNVDYSTKPNAYSQVEFPESPIMGFWVDTEDGIRWQFDKERSRNLTSYIYYPGKIEYSGRHIVKSTAHLIGLTNTLGSPTPPLINPPQQRYGFQNEGSLVDIIQDVSCYCLKASYIKRSTKLWPERLVRTQKPSPIPRPTFHLLVIPALADDLCVIYPADFSKHFKIGLYAKSDKNEIYAIFCDKSIDFIDIKVQVYSRYPVRGVFPSYGIETYRADGSLAFSSKNPPLLPIFVTNSEYINGIPPANYQLGCIFSRVDSFVHAQFKGQWDGTAACIFNGISWTSPTKWKSELMGFSDGGEGGNTGCFHEMGTLDWDTYVWMHHVKVDWKEYKWVAYSLPNFEKNKERLSKIGVFMGAVVY